MERDEMVRIDEAITDAIGAGDLDALDKLMAPDLAADFKEGIGQIWQAFPDYAGQVEATGWQFGSSITARTRANGWASPRPADR
jgi:hypothetical protein